MRKNRYKVGTKIREKAPEFFHLSQTQHSANVEMKKM